MDFKQFYNSEEHSDVDIVLCFRIDDSLEGPPPKKPRRANADEEPLEEHLPGHAVILKGCSEKFR